MNENRVSFQPWLFQSEPGLSLYEDCNDANLLRKDPALKAASDRLPSDKPEVWLGMQADYDLRIAQRTIRPEIAKRVHRHAA